MTKVYYDNVFAISAEILDNILDKADICYLYNRLHLIALINKNLRYTSYKKDVAKIYHISDIAIKEYATTLLQK